MPCISLHWVFFFGPWIILAFCMITGYWNYKRGYNERQLEELKEKQ